MYLCEMDSNEKKISYSVPEEGSLALLALGAVGIRAWKRKRKVKTEEDED